jgi:hypothetical protein
MKFKCINNERFLNDLTLNKEYEATDRGNYDIIWIKNDSGRDTWYNINRFIEVEETQTNPEPETEKIQTENKTYIRRFPSGAIRSDDRGRERPDFVSPYAIHALGKYLANTENSFAKVNYLLGIPVSECWSSLCRHHVELGRLIAKKYTIDPSSVTNEEIEHAAAALTFNGIAMLHTLELIKRGEYKEVYNKTEYILKEEYEKSINPSINYINEKPFEQQNGGY